MKYKEIEGDLIDLAKKGKFDVIAHGCNCFCTMGAGLAPQMAKAFGADKFPMEDKEYVGDINKLGTIDWEIVCLVNSEVVDHFDLNDDDLPTYLTVVNCYSQYGFGKNHANGTAAPLDYEALTLCMRKMNHLFKGKHIGLPLIGCQLAGGIWDVSDLSFAKQVDFESCVHRDVKTIIKEELSDCQVTIVHYKP